MNGATFPRTNTKKTSSMTWDLPRSGVESRRNRWSKGMYCHSTLSDNLYSDSISVTPLRAFLQTTMLSTDVETDETDEHNKKEVCYTVFSCVVTDLDSRRE